VSLASDVRLLSGTPPFDRLSREVVQLIVFAGQRRKISEGALLFKEGEARDGGDFVLSGSLELKSGSQTRTASAGTLLGQAALLAPCVASCDARALEASQALHIPRATFLRVVGEFPDVAADVRNAILARTAALATALEEVLERLYDPQ